MSLTADDRARIVALEGAANFRDFGGYAAGAGRRVVRGRLYRSNRLSLLSPADIVVLERTGIAAVFDLRSAREREADPTAWQAPHLAFHSWPPGDKRRLVDMAREFPDTAAGAEALMLHFYAALPRMMRHAMGGFLQQVAASAVPFVVHCSAGKDRTGLAAGLLLTILGVAEETVLGDYAMTERIVAGEDDMARSLFVGKDGGGRAQAAMRGAFSPEAIAVMRSARPEFLASAFAGMAREYGGLAGYCDAIGVDAALRARLVETLTEPA